MFKITIEDITKLDDAQLSQLLDHLLHLEALSHDIPLSGVRVSLKPYTADGGDDGYIEWTGGPARTDYLPNRIVLFQCKATWRSRDMTPAKCADEIGREDTSQPESSHVDGKKKIILKRKIRRGVEAALDKGATYILFCTEEFSPEEQERRISAIKEAIGICGKPYYNTVNIQIYDAKRISNWVNRYIAAVRIILGWTGKSKPFSMKTWEMLSKHPELNRFKYILSDANIKYIETIRHHFLTSSEPFRIVGLSGLGKTRLSIEF